MYVVFRPATADDAPHVAAIWYEGWCDGHVGGVSRELIAARTRASFQRRAAERVSDTTVAVVDGCVGGFMMVVRDEVEQKVTRDGTLRKL